MISFTVSFSCLKRKNKIILTTFTDLFWQCNQISSIMPLLMKCVNIENHNNLTIRNALRYEEHFCISTVDETAEMHYVRYFTYSCFVLVITCVNMIWKISYVVWEYTNVNTAAFSCYAYLHNSLCKIV